MASFIDITARREAEEALRQKTQDLGERVKELNCLYGISKLIEKEGASIESVFKGTSEILPPSWQYPAITCARITIEDMEFRTQNHAETQWKQRSDILVFGKKAGIAEVAYLEERPEIDEGPFLAEERRLIDAVAERLERYVERRRAEEALRDSEEKWRLLTVNTDYTIMVVDSNNVVQDINKTIPPETPQDVIGRNIYEYVAKEHQGAFPFSGTLS